jgi:hypothetical protein
MEWHAADGSVMSQAEWAKSAGSVDGEAATENETGAGETGAGETGEGETGAGETGEGEADAAAVAEGDDTAQ